MPFRITLPLSYLNYFDRVNSHISGRIGQVIDEILSPDLEPNRLSPLIERVIVFSQRSPDRLEYPEVLLSCAIAHLKSKAFQAARDYIVEAKIIYEDQDDPFRAAIASWLQWFPEHELEEHVYARDCLIHARDTLQKFIDANLYFIAHESTSKAEEEEKRDLNDWFQERIDEINFDLAVSPYEMFTWLSPFSDLAPILSPWAKHLRDKIMGYLLDKDYHHIRPLLDDMRNTALINKDFEEMPEIFIFTAVVSYQIDELETAQIDMDRAVEYFPHRQHKQAVARWMKGITFWKQDEIAKATFQWNRAVQDFKQLWAEAQHTDAVHKIAWYREKTHLIESAIAREIGTR